MADELNEAIQHVSEMTRGMMVTQMIAQGIDAYDKFACAAMQSLLSILDLNEHSPDNIALMAWEAADAMMEERKKRGIGGVPSNGEPNDHSR